MSDPKFPEGSDNYQGEDFGAGKTSSKTPKPAPFPQHPDNYQGEDYDVPQGEEPERDWKEDFLHPERNPESSKG